ncbi:MAG TPA: FkbM family methyltransferase [Terrimicrobiaceae bacterium]
MNFAKALVQNMLRTFGYQISRVANDASRLQVVADVRQQPTMLGGLERVKSRNVSIRTVIDVGASDGSWTEKCLAVFPDARYLLIEALYVHEPKLRELVNVRPNINYVVAAAGDREGEVHFYYADDPYGGAASHSPFQSHDLVVPLTTIDTQVSQRSLTGPYLIKLDTHGFELPILDGAAGTLRQTELLIIEAYNFEMNRAERVLRFHELCAYMETRGFRCSDLADPLYRTRDYMLWQMDLFFEPYAYPRDSG